MTELKFVTSAGVDNDVFRDAHNIRVNVFVNEQRVPYENELDELDSIATHVVLYVDGKPVACARLVFENETVKLGRVAVLKQYRRKGYALKISQFCIDFARKNGANFAYVNAQTYITELYKKLGFVCEGEDFFEENIPHVRMVRGIDL